jgi:hypothetical protein
MANANGSTIMINVGKKKRTHLLISDPDGRFDSTKTTVTSVTDSLGIISFTPKPPRVHSPKTLTVVIHSAVFHVKRFDDPTTAMLVVTIINGTTPIPVDSIPVVLIPDADGCDEP